MSLILLLTFFWGLVINVIISIPFAFKKSVTKKSLIYLIITHILTFLLFGYINVYELLEFGVFGYLSGFTWGNLYLDCVLIHFLDLFFFFLYIFELFKKETNLEKISKIKIYFYNLIKIEAILFVIICICLFCFSQILINLLE